jgi:arginyl-tRNA synthetase
MKSTIEQLLKLALTGLKSKTLIGLEGPSWIQVDRTKKASHGDFSTNLAFLLAKSCAHSPRIIAQWLVDELPVHGQIRHVEIAESGFINFFIRATDRAQRIETLLRADESYVTPQAQGIDVCFNDTDQMIYAHNRICSVLRQVKEGGLYDDEATGIQHLNALSTPHEHTLIDLLARTCEPHQMVYYLRELATGVHAYYNAVALLCEDVSIRCARLCLLRAIRHVLRQGMQLLGVFAPESV